MITSPDPELEDGHVVLRRWSFDDLHCIEEAGGDPAIPAGTTVPAVFTEDEGRAFIERQWGRTEHGEGVSLAIHSKTAQRAVGLVVILVRPQPGVVGLGYWVVPNARGSGCASRAASLASTWAIGAAGYSRIEAWVEPGNVASHRVLERAGFQHEGRLRSFLAVGPTRSDADVYSRIAES